MGFFDSIVDDVKDKAQGAAKDVAGYFLDSAANKISGPKIGQAQGGNKSAEEIAKGETGSPAQPSIPPSPFAIGNLFRADASVKDGGFPIWPVLIGGLVIGYFLFRRKR